MLFEMDSITEYAEEEFQSWNAAVHYITQITGLDLSAYLEKPKSLAEQIQTAEHRIDSQAGCMENAERSR